MYPILEKRSTVLLLLLLCMSRSGYPPWILKWGGLESSGQRLISSIGKTKRIGFFSAKTKYFPNFQIFWFEIFWYFWIFWPFLTIVGFFEFFIDFWIFFGFFFNFFDFFVFFFYFFSRQEEKKCYPLSCPILWGRDLTRALQSSPFQISGGGYPERDGRRKTEQDGSNPCV